MERDFIAFVAGLMGVDPDAIGLETGYKSIPQWDSLMMLTLVMELEARYAVAIPIEVVQSVRTLGDLYATVRG